MSDTEYKVLTSRKDIHWFCNPCDIKVMHCIQIENELEYLNWTETSKFYIDNGYKAEGLWGEVGKV